MVYDRSSVINEQPDRQSETLLPAPSSEAVDIVIQVAEALEEGVGRVAIRHPSGMHGLRHGRRRGGASPLGLTLVSFDKGIPTGSYMYNCLLF